MIPLSAIIITKNEEGNIAACLDSVSFAAELIVLDDNSIDRTQEIAAAKGARVVSGQGWSGFGRQKNVALRLASQDWVLSLDADERVTRELRHEIEASIKSPAADCYAIPRRSWFCGKFMRFSGWSPDYVIRLFRRGSAHFSADPVHERLVTDGKVAKLKQHLLHYSYRDFSDVLAKMQVYSTYGGDKIAASGKNCSFCTALSRGTWTFLRTYFFRLGFLDGKLGLALAIYNAETVYYKYLKAWYHGQVRPQNVV